MISNVGIHQWDEFGRVGKAEPTRWWYDRGRVLWSQNFSIWDFSSSQVLWSLIL